MNSTFQLIEAVHNLHNKLITRRTTAEQAPDIQTAPLNIVVMGEINRGKSTFINALLGTPDLLPTGDSATTSAVFKIRYGETISYTVHYLPDDNNSTPPPERVTAQEIRDFGTEKGNPRNHKKVDYIEATTPAPLLAGGIVITDTPGLGGLMHYHSRNTWRHLPGADAIFFVTSSTEAPIGIPEQENLVQARAITHNLIFIQTKKDAQDRNALQRREANNRSIIANALRIPAESISYFCLSAHLKQRCDRGEAPAAIIPHTGFAQLMDFLQNTLLSSHTSIDTSKRLLSLAPKMEDIARHLQSRRAALEATTYSQKNTLLQEINRQEQQLDEWEQSQLPRIKQRLQQELNRLYINCKEEAATFKLHYNLHNEFKTAINETKTLLELEKTLNGIQEKLPNLAMSAVLRIRGTIEDRLSGIMLQLLEDIQQTDADTQLLQPQHNDTTALAINTHEIGTIAQELLNRKDVWRRLQTTGCKGIMGAATNNGLLNLLGAVAGVTLPGVGMVILSATALVAGGLWGFFFTHKKNNTALLQETKAQALSALEAAMGSTHNKIKGMLGNICDNYKQHYADTLCEFLAKRRQDLQEQTRNISESAAAPAPRSQELLELEEDERSFEQLRVALRAAAAY